MKAAIAGLVLLVISSVACIESSDQPAEVLADGTALPALTSTATTTRPMAAATIPFTPVPVVSDLDPDDLRGFAFPIEDGCLPSRDQVMPNAPRDYRSGFSEGVDFYHGDVCTPIDRGLPVLAMYPGIVIRADHEYDEIAASEADAYVARAEAQGFTDEQALDAFRGRQVWIDHGNGVVSRYASLESVEPTLAVGLAVRTGDIVGGVGESGTVEATAAPGTQIHLHIEVRIDQGFLGQVLPVDQVRRLYVQLFSPAADGE